MRILFFGTPAAAVPFLELLARRESVVGVVSQPDKAAGRGLRLNPTPVKRRALELGLRVFQPQRPSELCGELRGLSPELAVVVAYGRLLKPDLLAVSGLGALNVHFSLLPKYRGAAPVAWALARGETRTGVTLFWIDEGMDTGPVFLSRELDVRPEDDAASLLERLTVLGLEALEECLREIAAGRIVRRPQFGEASRAPLIKKEDGRISLESFAGQVHDLVRGMRLWPKAYLELAPPGPRRLLVLRTALPLAGSEEGAGAASACVGRLLRVERDKGFLIQCGGRSSLWVLTVQPEGKRPVAAADFLNGLRLKAGDLLPVK